MIRPIHNDWPGWQPTWKLWVARWRTAVSGSPELPDRLMLWVDSVGGYLVCLRDEVVLGQPAGGATPDVPILGDLSRRHAIIRRQGEGYSIEAVREVRLDGQSVQRTAPLWDGSVIELGRRSAIAIPPAASAQCHGAVGVRQSASHAALDRRGVADGRDAASWAPHPSSHVVSARLAKRSGSVPAGQPNWAAERLPRFRSMAQDKPGGPALRPRCRVEGEEFAFSLEPLGET